MCHDGNGHHSLENTSGITERNFQLTTAGAEIPVFEAAPVGERNGQVIIIHDIFGVNNFYHDLARRIANDGFTAYLPDLFVHVGGGVAQTREEAMARGGRISYPQAIEDVGSLISMIEDRGKVGTMGFCMGGTMVMHLASAEPRISGGVIYYGFPRNPSPKETRPSEPLAEASTVRSPLLGFWGDQDAGVGMDNVQEYENRLKAAGKDFDFTIYPGRGHGFLTFDESSADYPASIESFNKAIAFYGVNLAS